MADKVLIDIELQEIIYDELQRRGHDLPDRAWKIAGDIAAAIAASSGGTSVATPKRPVPCIGNDETCPCQDGDQCHYKAYDDTPAMAVQPQPQTGNVFSTPGATAVLRHMTAEDEAAENAAWDAVQPETTD